MNHIMIFIVQTIFSLVFAVIISKLFRPDATFLFIAGLAAFLLAASYGMAYLRKRKTDNPSDTP